jgi:hypothetical protein
MVYFQKKRKRSPVTLLAAYRNITIKEIANLFANI